jgi:purine-nucleoside phosphorylase
MHDAYDQKMNAKMEQIAQQENVTIHRGVYLGLQGPTFETPAEYKMVKILGADAVGMSTVPEIIVAKHMNMTCFGISVITDLGIEGQVVSVSHKEVQIAAEAAEKTLSKLMVRFLAD